MNTIADAFIRCAHLFEEKEPNYNDPNFNGYMERLSRWRQYEEEAMKILGWSVGDEEFDGYEFEDDDANYESILSYL